MLRLLVHLQVLTLVLAHRVATSTSTSTPRHRGDPHRSCSTSHGLTRPALDPGARRTVGRPWRGDDGQTTAEYALVLLGAAAIAALLITWASKSGAIGKLFDAVLSHVLGSVK